MATYAISDIHGCYSEFLAILDKINFSEKDILYVLGDVIDRGPNPIKCLKYIMEVSNIFMIKGNHEEMMINALLGDIYQDRFLWAYNGGDITYHKFKKLNNKSQEKILDYIRDLPNYFVLNNCVLVHAGINPFLINLDKSIEENLKNQHEKDLLWIRDSFLENSTNLKVPVIFGHTPTILLNKDRKPVFWKDSIQNDKIGIDCGCVFKEGNLGVLNLDTFEEIYLKEKSY